MCQEINLQCFQVYLRTQIFGRDVEIHHYANIYLFVMFFDRHNDVKLNFERIKLAFHKVVL